MCNPCRKALDAQIWEIAEHWFDRHHTRAVMKLSGVKETGLRTKDVGNVRVDKSDEILIAREETLKATKDLNATLLERLDRQLLFKFAS